MKSWSIVCCGLALGWACLIAPPAAAGDEPPEPIALGELSLDLDRLKQAKNQTFAYQTEAPGSDEVVGLGTLTLRTTVERDAILLRDTVEITYRGEKISAEISHRCRRNNFLSPVRLESQGSGSDEVGTFVVTVENELATITGDPRRKTMALPAETLSFAALQRIVTLLPRQQGTRIKVPYVLESEELLLKKDYLIESLGEEEIGRGDQRYACTRFRVTSPQISPLVLWVDSDGQLQRMLIDHRKLLDLIPPAEK